MSEELKKEEALALIEQDKKDRCEAATKELQAICEKYKVNLIAVTQIAGNQVSQAVQFVA